MKTFYVTKLKNRRAFSLFRHCKARSLFLIFLLSFSFLKTQAQSKKLLAEKLWGELDLQTLAKEVTSELRLSPQDSMLFFNDFLGATQWERRAAFFLKVSQDEVTPLNSGLYLQQLRKEYLKEYPTFLTIKSSLISDRQSNKRLEEANGPCTNMGFESGDFSGWNGSIQTRRASGSNEDPIPGPLLSGFRQHCVMTPTMRDPYIANLPVVPPGKMRSVRLGNAVAGGHVAKMWQTFQVDSTNMVFTYRYAVVLENPLNDNNGHEKLNSPHFEVVMLDQNEDTIKCAEYSVIVASNLPSYTHVCASGDSPSQMGNYGCPNGAVGADGSIMNPNPVPVSNPDRNGSCGDPNRNSDLYYRNWTAVSVVLDNYLGQNVTVYFIAADCVPSGHLGYAYVQAECSSFKPAQPIFICSGKQTKTLSAPDGFGSYNWLGPGIIGASNRQTITINKSGTYKMVLIPATNHPCPDTQTVVVREHCAPLPISKMFCEEVKGSKKVSGINLSAYNIEITDTLATANVLSWHSALPANASNKITSPSNLTVNDGGQYYAVIANVSFPNDTVLLSFIIHPKPNIVFPNPPVACAGGNPFSLSGVTPADGVFSGPNVNSSGIFNPISIGSYPIKYKVTNVQGCVDSLTKTVVVQDKPTIQAMGDTKACYQNEPLLLPISVSTLSDSVLWASSFGTVANPKSKTTNLVVLGTAPLERTIQVTVAAFSKTCPTLRDTITIVTYQLPVVTVPKDTLICSFTGNSIVTAKGTVQYQDSVHWTGGATYSDRYILAPSAHIAYTYPQKTSNQLILSAFKQTCPVVNDTFLVSIQPKPIVKAQNDTTFCSTLNTIPLKGFVQGTDNLLWTASGLVGSFTSPNAINTNFAKPTSSSSASALFILTGSSQNCGNAVDSAQVTWEALPDISLSGPVSVCKNLPTVKNLIASLTNSTNMTWIGQGGILSPSTSSLNAEYEPSLPEIQLGEIVLQAATLKVPGQLCPVAKDTIKIAITLPPLADAGLPDTVCLNSIVSKTTVPNPNWTYQWTSPKSGTVLSVAPSVSFTASKDTNRIYLTVNDNHSCKSQDSVTVLAIVPPLLSLPATLCFYQPVSVTATLQNVPSAGSYTWKKEGLSLNHSSSTFLFSQIGDYSYHYTYKTCEASAPIKVLAPPVLKVPPVEACENTMTQLVANPIKDAYYYWANKAPSTSSVYSVNSGNGLSQMKVVVMDANGCKDSTFTDVNITPYPAFSLKGEDICPGQTKQLTATLHQPSLASKYSIEYQWSKNGQKISLPKWQDLTYSEPGTYLLELSITTCKSSGSKLISLKPYPKIDIPTHYKFCFETDLPLVLNSNVFSHYAWFGGEGLIDTLQSIKVSPHQDSFYSLFVKNEFGCKDSVQVKVRKVCPPRLFVPNVITPLSDDVNSALHIYGAHYTNFELTIFSRWGEIIYNTHDPKQVWNGLYKSENMPIGVYPWMVTYEGDSEEYKGPYKKVGEVTIVR